MEHYKISKLLKDLSVSKFVTKKKSIEVNDLSSGQYFVSKNISLKLQIQIRVIIVMHILLQKGK